MHLVVKLYEATDNKDHAGFFSSTYLMVNPTDQRLTMVKAERAQICDSIDSLVFRMFSKVSGIAQFHKAVWSIVTCLKRAVPVRFDRRLAYPLELPQVQSLCSSVMRWQLDLRLLTFSLPPHW